MYDREKEDCAHNPPIARENMDAPCEEPLYKTRDYTGGHRSYGGTGPGALERVSQADAVIAAYHPWMLKRNDMSETTFQESQEVLTPVSVQHALIVTWAMVGGRA